MLTLLYFILAISILVAIHEYGHFWVARRCGVQVKRFSIGFGKPLWSFKDKYGTEFSIAPIPMGGYVSMLDEREGNVPDELKPYAYNNKSPWQRMAIASAGPLANFIFAIAAYWFIFVAGTTGLVPVVGGVTEGSAAARAGVQVGDQVIEVNGKATNTWEDVNWQLIGFLGESGTIGLTLSTQGGNRHYADLTVERWLSEDEMPNPMRALGLEPRTLPIPAVMGQVMPDGAAAAAGLQDGDKILSVNNTAIADWYALVDWVQRSAGASLTLVIERHQKHQTLTLMPASRVGDDGRAVGFMGAAVAVPQYPAHWLSTRSVGVVDGLLLGAQKTWDTTYFTLTSLWKMIAGQISMKNLSGPVSIAKVAGASAAGGLESFVSFLALLSVSLGVLNLLPVPVLDGGHILFCVAEIIQGKPLSERIQQWAVKFGLFLLLGLMLVAFYNDLSRL